MNLCAINGRITKQPEIRETANGILTCSFTVAVQRDYKNANGDYDADFINCVAYRQTAEYITKYIDKGNLMSVVGHITVNTYENDKGEKQTYTNVVADKVKRLEKRTENESSENKSNDPLNDFDDITITDDFDLPF